MLILELCDETLSVIFGVMPYYLFRFASAVMDYVSYIVVIFPRLEYA